MTEAPERIYYTPLPLSKKHDVRQDALGFAWREPAEGRIAYTPEAGLAQPCASVKPLEWMYPEHHKDFEYVETVVGRYQVRETFYEGKGYLSLPKEHGYHKAGNTLEEAKSAAQADYERRITEALSIRTEAEVRKEWQSELPDYIDLYRIIKRSGARKHGDIAKAIAQAITSLIEGEADD